MPSIIHNDVKAPARLCDEVVQEDGVGLIARKDLGICDVLCSSQRLIIEGASGKLVVLTAAHFSTHAASYSI